MRDSKPLWRLVPSEPTPEMLEACTGTAPGSRTRDLLRAEVMRMAAEDYRNMLDAAPAAECPLRFPTMLRKMWSGGDVQQWLNREWAALTAAGFAAPQLPSSEAQPEAWLNTEDGSIEHNHKPWMGPEWEPLVRASRRPTPVVPEGYVLVPCEASPPMLEAMAGVYGQQSSPHWYKARQREYKNMLDAAAVSVEVDYA